MTAEENNRVITFGCRLNSYESESIKIAIEKSSQKNLIVFNSCAVTSEAERQLRQSIRKTKQENPNAKIVVTGCAAQINPEKYAKMSEIDLVLGNQEKSDSKNYSFERKNSNETKKQPLNLNHQDKLFFSEKEKNFNFLKQDEEAKILVNDIMSVKKTAPQLVSYFDNKSRAFLEIQNGCNHRCTFCIIPFGRGNSRSVPFGEIASQARSMILAGYNEIVLTGVDISDYGKDFDSPISLAQMIKRLLKLVPELSRVRLSSIDVAEIDDELINLIVNEPRFMPYLHLSVQSGDNMILKRMKRRHSREQIIEFCSKLKKLRPEITFGADIIAGFPTEDNDMFENSVKLIKEANIIFAHIFPYSKRGGTPAAKMPQITKSIIKERAKILRQTSNEELSNYLKDQIGKKFSVIIEKSNFGKTENFLDVKILNNNFKEKTLQNVEIIGVENNHLLGIS